MGWNGSGTVTRTNGTYTGVNLWAQSRDAALTMDPEYFDTHDQDLAAAITNALAKDGQNAATANINLGSNRIISLALGTAVTDALRVDQFQRGSVIWGGEAGISSSAMTITLAPAPVAYTDGMLIAWKQPSTNTGATTMNVNSLGAKALKDIEGQALLARQLKIGCVYFGIYLTDGFYVINANQDSRVTFDVVAAAGSNQATATVLTGAHNRVTDADGAKGVKMPAGAGGLRMSVYNYSTTSTLKLYPQSSGRLGSGSVDAAVDVPATRVLHLTAMDGGIWGYVT